MIPSLEFRDGRARVVAVSKDRETLDRMPPCRAGRSDAEDLVEPEVRTFDILEFG